MQYAQLRTKSTVHMNFDGVLFIARVLIFLGLFS